MCERASIIVLGLACNGNGDFGDSSFVDVNVVGILGILRDQTRMTALLKIGRLGGRR